MTGNSQVRNREELEKSLENEDVTLLLVCLGGADEPGPVEPDAVRRIGLVNVKEWGRNPILGIWLKPEVQGNVTVTEFGLFWYYLV